MVENSTSNGNQGPPGLCARLQKADSGDPSLVFKAEDQTTPGLHALLIGVSAYSSLKGGPSQPQNQPNLTLSRSLGQLIGPAQSAYNVAQFCQARAAKLSKPLRTLRLLASPSPEEQADNPDLGQFEPATAANVTKALQAWRKDACRSDEEVTLFYFAGHGLQLSAPNTLLLFADFLGGNAMLDHAMEVNTIYNGMEVSKYVQTIARTQFYFIDSCRVGSDVFSQIEIKGTCTPWDVYITGPIIRDAAPIFYATGPGEPAKTLATERTTKFAKRLLRCLKGDGAERVGNGAWAVTIESLIHALKKLSDAENQAAGATIDDADISGWRNGFTVIHMLDEAPKVPCTLTFVPPEVQKGLALVLDNRRSPPLRFPQSSVIPVTETYLQTPMWFPQSPIALCVISRSICCRRNGL